MNIKELVRGISEYYSPKIIGEVNDVYIKIAKINGDKVPWHNHENEDELFLILEGSLLFETKGEDSFIMNKDDFHIVKRGKYHRVSSDNECTILLIENKSTAHTGEVKSEITKTVKQQKLK